MKKGISIGIIALFIVTAVSPMVIGFKSDAVEDVTNDRIEDIHGLKYDDRGYFINNHLVEKNANLVNTNNGPSLIHRETYSKGGSPEITDKSNDAKPYLDIISVRFVEDSTEPEYIWTEMKLRDLKRRFHTYYSVFWSYNDTRYLSQTLFTISGVFFRYSYLKNGNWHSNSTQGEFDVKNNVIKVKIPKKGINDPQVGERFTFTTAFSILEGVTKPIFVDYAPDCGYGKDYLIGGGNVDKDPGIQLIHCDFRLALYTTQNVGSFNLSYFMPLNHGNQAPIICSVRNDSTLKPTQYRIINDTNPPNKLIHFEFPSLKVNESKYIHLDFWVFVKDEYFKDYPHYVKIPDESEFPEFTKNWLVSTEAIQTNKILIKIFAKIIRDSTDNLRELADNIVQFTMLRYSMLRSIYHPQDALTTLLTKGICVGTANLAAALFRANSIPTRHVYVICTGSNVGHAACEYFCPGYDWIPADPTFARTPYEPAYAVTLRVNYPVDENEAGCFFRKNRGNEPFYWFSEDCIDLKFSLTNGTSSRSQLISSIDNSTYYQNLEALNITKDVWEWYTTYLGQELNESEQEHFENAVTYQGYAVVCFKQGDISGYIDNMTYAYNEYMEICSRS